MTDPKSDERPFSSLAFGLLMLMVVISDVRHAPDWRLTSFDVISDIVLYVMMLKCIWLDRVGLGYFITILAISLTAWCNELYGRPWTVGTQPYFVIPAMATLGLTWLFYWDWINKKPRGVA